MSMICIGYIMSGNQESYSNYTNQLKRLAEQYGRGIFFNIDWDEPVLTHVPQDALIFSLADDDTWNNCEMLFLPDGWYLNDEMNTQSFSERMHFLCDIANLVTSRGDILCFYIGLSGVPYEEYDMFTVCSYELQHCLSATVGFNGDDSAVHITVQ